MEKTSTRTTLSLTAAINQMRVMHDMPIHPGFEISEELTRDPRSIIYDQAENRLYSAKALLLHALR